ncbi:MAG TPA: integrase family protein, partial [Novosphingobium sp.]|nr:integrase family protein [Novosphingobium sp.]
MTPVKLSKRSVDGLLSPSKGQAVLWDTEVRGYGVRVLPSGTKTFILQYRNPEGIQRRINIGRYGILTVDQARDQARLFLASVIKGEDPADETRRARKGMTVAEMCEWYLTEARAGNILGRLNRPIKASSLDMDESRIKTHIIPLLGKRVVAQLSVADVEQMQSDVKNGKTAKARSGGRGGRATGGAGVASRCLGTLQAIIGHAKHKGLLATHPTQGAKKLASKKRTRRLSVTEIEMLGKAIAYAEQNRENPVALGVLKTLVLTGYRREEAQAMQRSWVNVTGGFVSFPDTKGGAQVRAIGPAALKVIQSQSEILGSPYVFPSDMGAGPYTAVSSCLDR